MITENQFFNLKLSRPAEMKGGSLLTEEILIVKLLYSSSSLQNIFNGMQNSPASTNILAGVRMLKEIGCLKGINNDNREINITTAATQHDLYDGIITNVGNLVARLPVKPQGSLFLIMAKLFDVMEEAIIITSCEKAGNLFNQGSHGHIKAHRIKDQWYVTASGDRHKRSSDWYVNLMVHVNLRRSLQRSMILNGQNNIIYSLRHCLKPKIMYRDSKSNFKNWESMMIVRASRRNSPKK